MPSQKHPEDMVPVLLDRLNKAKKNAFKQPDDASESSPCIGKFQEIEEKIHQMQGKLPSIMNCQGELVGKFRYLEYQIDNDVFNEPKSSDDEIQKQLDDIGATVQSIEELMSMFKVKEMMEKSEQTKEKVVNSQPKQSRDFDFETPGEEVSRLHLEEKIFTKAAMSEFQASFDCLESFQQKMCLLSLSIFPENSLIKKTPLIYWWMGERLVSRTGNKTAHEAGDYIFREFIKNGFLTPVCENYSQLIDSCIVHGVKNPTERHHSPLVNTFTVNPWIRLMLMRVANKNKFFNFDSRGKLRNGSCRAFFSSGNIENYNLNSDTKEEPLLSIFNLNERYLGFKQDWLPKFRRLEVLQLGRWQRSPKHHIEVVNVECLKGLGSQKKLRYISLRGISRITTLPPSISKLLSLEILDIRACHNLERLPPDVSSLRNLTHLDLSECYLLESMPKGLEDLKALQVLKGFVIGNTGRNASKLSELADLQHLRKLSIRIASGAKVEDGELSSLEKFEKLHILVVLWGAISNPSTETTPKSFSVPPNLKKLDLRCVPMKTAPDWLRPSQLQLLEKLYIRGGQLSSLDKEENLHWNVQIVRLKYLKYLELEKDKLKELFPRVKYIEIVNCGNNSEHVINTNFTEYM